MVGGILGKEAAKYTDKDKEMRKRLFGRAAKHFMFMDDNEEQYNGK
ncbi:MAG: hypothetical protein PHR62_06185 [Paludibacter sp.]|nr:hypothetical protein [Paludibacter sp.]